MIFILILKIVFFSLKFTIFYKYSTYFVNEELKNVSSNAKLNVWYIIFQHPACRCIYMKIQ